MDERLDLASDMLDKRERLNEQAHRQREARDRLNDETRRFARERDELNAKVRALVEQANAHRAKRDELNAQVREGKVQRDALNRVAQERAETLGQLRRARGESNGPPTARLKAELTRLEYEQQTKVLTPPKEKALIEQIAALQKQVRERESGNPGGEPEDLRAATEAFHASRAAAEAQHQLVTQLARDAQSEHESMVGLFAQADAMRKEADAAQAEFVKRKVEADRTHHGYIEAIQGIRDLERVADALRAGAPGAHGMSTLGQAAATRDQVTADEIFDRFRRGEKLSTEDLMALQKAGRL